MTCRTRGWIAIAIIVTWLAITAWLALSLITLRHQITVDCSGVVAQLDLSEWVDLCRQ